MMLCASDPQYQLKHGYNTTIKSFYGNGQVDAGFGSDDSVCLGVSEVAADI